MCEWAPTGAMLPVTFFLHIVLSSFYFSRRIVHSCLFWMPRPSQNWAELKSLSISHMGPMVCLTRWARTDGVCNSGANCWNPISDQPLYPQNRISLSVSHRKGWAEAADSNYLSVPSWWEQVHVFTVCCHYCEKNTNLLEPNKTKSPAWQ